MPGYELIDRDELKEISKIFKNGSIFYRYGFNKIRKNKFIVKSFENYFKRYVKSKYSLAVSSGTAALRVALASLGIKSGDQVITQSFTFVATVEAIVEAGATPICTEIDNNLNMDITDLEKKITNKTKAIIVVHMLGIPSYLDEIKKICKKKKIFLIEDTAWGLGAKYKGKMLGTHGDIGTYSFDFAKKITTGEGGMVTFRKKEFYKKASAWHDHGHENNPKYERWEDTRTSSGFNFRMSEITAAIGIAQLKKIKKIEKKHKVNFEELVNKIKFIKGLKFRQCQIGCTQSHDALIIILPNKFLASKLKLALNVNNINTKILPEAKTWHFAKYWTHIPQLRIKSNDLIKSQNFLLNCVALPINCYMDKKMKKNFIDTVNHFVQLNL